MHLGFVSAILPDQSLEKVFSIASDIGYDCVELMCWPPGKADRRYAGVTHIDVTSMTPQRISDIHKLCNLYGVNISGLGYYPNPLVADQAQGQVYIEHIKKIIIVAKDLGVGLVNTFIGKDHRKSVDDNWSRFEEVWKDIISHAERHEVKVGIENCPMLFTEDEWPGGINLATTPHIWRRMYESIHSEFFGLNYDPSHMILQHMDYEKPIRDFSHKLFHIHAKDIRIDKHILDERGVFSLPNEWHTPKLPGMGDIDWGQFCSTLNGVGYTGAICVEVEDRAFEGPLERRVASLQQSYNYLRQFVK